MYKRQRLVAEVGLGLAPGIAFAPEAEGWLRWCFASRELALSLIHISEPTRPY